MKIRLKKNNQKRINGMAHCKIKSFFQTIGSCCEIIFNSKTIKIDKSKQ
jgi:hypothetical protein